MKALSIKQPWVWAIFNLGKDVENRDWPTRFRGTIAVHASKSYTFADYEDLYFTVREMKGDKWVHLPSYDHLKLTTGAIIGLIDIVDCVSKSASPWFCGDYGFVLNNPRLLETPLPCRGALGFWSVPDEIEQTILRSKI